MTGIALYYLCTYSCLLFYRWRNLFENVLYLKGYADDQVRRRIVRSSRGYRAAYILLSMLRLKLLLVLDCFQPTLRSVPYRRPPFMRRDFHVNINRLAVFVRIILTGIFLLTSPFCPAVARRFPCGCHLTITLPLPCSPDDILNSRFMATHAPQLLVCLN